MTLIAVITCVFVGCKSIPTADKIYIASYATGAASAEILNQTKISDKTASAIVKTLNTMQVYVPATNETFTTKWMPIVSGNIVKMVESKELTTTEGKVVELAFTTICSGLDYLVEKRYPEAKTYGDLVSSAIYGFSSGFLSYFDKAKTFSSRRVSASLDEDEFARAYEYLLKK